MHLCQNEVRVVQTDSTHASSEVQLASEKHAASRSSNCNQRSELSNDLVNIQAYRSIASENGLEFILYLYFMYTQNMSHIL